MIRAGTNSHGPDAATIAAMIEEARRLAAAAADDKGLPFESANVELMAAVKSLDPANYERIRAMLKDSGVRVPELDRLIAAKLGENNPDAVKLMDRAGWK